MKNITNSLKRLYITRWNQVPIAFFVVGLVFSGISPLKIDSQKANAAEKQIVSDNPLLIVKNNSILPVSSLPQYEVAHTFNVLVTAYSSTPEETDDTPFVTAAGTGVRDGIVANNLLPFGTKIRMPSLYGDKIFVVEDRMNAKKSDYHVDVWYPSKREAINFGSKITSVQILN